MNYDDRIRPINADRIRLILDMDSFLKDGPGFYARPINPLVTSLFGGDNLGLNDGRYTVAELRAEYALRGVTTREFNLLISDAFEHIQVAPGTVDWGQRVFSYNSQSARLSEDTVFVIDGANSHLENVHLRMVDDNFGFISDSSYLRVR